MRLYRTQLPCTEAELRADLAAYKTAVEAHKRTVGVPAPQPRYDLTYQLMQEELEVVEIPPPPPLVEPEEPVLPALLPPPPPSPEQQRQMALTAARWALLLRHADTLIAEEKAKNSPHPAVQQLLNLEK